MANHEFPANFLRQFNDMAFLIRDVIAETEDIQPEHIPLAQFDPTIQQPDDPEMFKRMGHYETLGTIKVPIDDLFLIHPEQIVSQAYKIARTLPDDHVNSYAENGKLGELEHKTFCAAAQNLLTRAMMTGIGLGPELDKNQYLEIVNETTNRWNTQFSEDK